MSLKRPHPLGVSFPKRIYRFKWGLLLVTTAVSLAAADSQSQAETQDLEEALHASLRAASERNFEGSIEFTRRSERPANPSLELEMQRRAGAPLPSTGDALIDAENRAKRLALLERLLHDSQERHSFEARYLVTRVSGQRVRVESWQGDVHKVCAATPEKAWLHFPGSAHVTEVANRSSETFENRHIRDALYKARSAESLFLGKFVPPDAVIKSDSIQPLDDDRVSAELTWFSPKTGSHDYQVVFRRFGTRWLIISANRKNAQSESQYHLDDYRKVGEQWIAHGVTYSWLIAGNGEDQRTVEHYEILSVLPAAEIQEETFLPPTTDAKLNRPVFSVRSIDREGSKLRNIESGEVGVENDR